MGVKERYAHLPPLPDDIRERLSRLGEVLRRHPVRLAYLFGSASRNLSGSADIDIAVLPGRGFSFRALYADLSLALGTDRLDLVDLRVAPPHLQAEIIATGRCILIQSEGESKCRAKYSL
ncbi:MAG TPA: nucleotidyltransferase domain-containing protein [Armatimonadetes bacterium]|nr:nucleotidyltransferase domain-containing protein [Armatimonadota bacterium]